MEHQQEKVMKRAEEYWESVAPELQMLDLKLRVSALHALSVAVRMQATYSPNSPNQRHQLSYGFFKTVDVHGRVAVAVPLVAEGCAHINTDATRAVANIP